MRQQIRENVEREALRQAGRFAEDLGPDLREAAEQGTKRVTEAINERLKTFAGVARKTTSEENFAGVNESEILKFVPDRRTISGSAALFLGLFFLVILPGGLKLASVLFFAFGAFHFIVGYILKAKVDVPDGFTPVSCRFGEPVERHVHKGRNWNLAFPYFIPFLVSQRDLVVNTRNAGFTRDFASISMRNQITLRITDAATMVKAASPAMLMRIVDVYSSYDVLRVITSMTDSRVKFMGRDKMDNLVEALNSALRERFGAVAIRASMPEAENPVMDDLERVRTSLKAIAALNEERQVRLEASVKSVEQEIRTSRKIARTQAIRLQQRRIDLETFIAQSVNTDRPGLLMGARQQLEAMLSEVKRDVATWKARVQKAKVFVANKPSMQINLALRMAAIKRQIQQRLIPERVHVLGVDGIGTGVGFSIGNTLLGPLLEAA